MAQSLSAKIATMAPGMVDWQVANLLNLPDATTNGTKAVNVAVSDARAILMTSTAWGQIVMIAEGKYNPLTNQPAAANLQAVCITVRDAHLNLTTFKMTDPATAAAVKGMVDSLLGAALISQATHDTLLALGVAPASWADLNNNGAPVTPRDVGLARGAVA